MLESTPIIIYIIMLLDCVLRCNSTGAVPGEGMRGELGVVSEAVRQDGQALAFASEAMKDSRCVAVQCHAIATCGVLPPPLPSTLS